MTGSLFSYSILNLSSHSVSVQRRDRSLFSFLHLYQVPSLYPFFLFSLTLSKDVTGHCPFHFTSLPRPLFLPVSFVFSWLFCLPPGSLFALSFRSVSVQRRGRYSVPPFDLNRSPCDLFFLLLAQCVCPKTWQVLCSLPFLLCLPPFTWSLADLFWLHSVSVQRRDRSLLPIPLTFHLHWGHLLPPFFKLFDFWLSLCDFLCEST